jgi:hypothetical protein
MVENSTYGHLCSICCGGLGKDKLGAVTFGDDSTPTRYLIPNVRARPKNLNSTRRYVSSDGSSRMKHAYVPLTQDVIRRMFYPFLTLMLIVTLTYKINATRRPPIRPAPRQVPAGFFNNVECSDPVRYCPLNLSCSLTSTLLVIHC